MYRRRPEGGARIGAPLRTLLHTNLICRNGKLYCNSHINYRLFTVYLADVLESRSSAEVFACVLNTAATSSFALIKLKLR